MRNISCLVWKLGKGLLSLLKQTHKKRYMKAEHGVRTRIANKYGKSLTWLKKIERGEFNKGHPAIAEMEEIVLITAVLDYDIDRAEKELAMLKGRRAALLEETFKRLGL